MRNHGHWALLPCFTVFAIAAFTAGAEAQLTSAQQSALKANCRSDFMSKCSGVTPGGKDALVCLQKNVNSLSAACKSAVSATLPPPAAPAAAKPVEPAPTAVAAPSPPAAPQPAAAPAPTPAVPPKAAIAAPPKAVKPAAAAVAAPTAAQQNAMKQACRSDFMAKCAGVQPGGKDALACLQRKVGTLSPSCKQVVSATMGAPARAAAPAAAAAPAGVAPSAGPSAQQMSAVKFTCRNDFRRLCKGIQPGGPDALACLQSNAARLTPDCKTSLADIADSVPASAATPTAAGAAAPAAAAAAATPRRLPPGITPAGRILRRVMERNR